MAALGGMQACPVPNQPDGTLRLEDVEASVRTEDVHHPRTRLVCLENTQNICGGVALLPEYTRRVAEFAHAHGLKLHVDGARLFNAAVAQGVEASALAGMADSVMFCLSKSLCAPVGSVLCGPEDFIAEARRYRKMVGGGMRQAGIIAAAGVVALESMIERLEDDHAHARLLADGLRNILEIELDANTPQTNMVYFNLAPGAKLTAAEVAERMRPRRIILDWEGPRRFRLVTHYWIAPKDIEKVVAAFREVLRG
jgi:threonine aldolase